MPPFSSALLPLSLKEIGGLGPTEGNCVSRLPTIVTLRNVTRKAAGHSRRHLSIVCLCVSLFPPFFFSPPLTCVHYYCHGLAYIEKVECSVFWDRLRREVQELKDRESHRDRAQLYFLFTQALFETLGRNRGCIHLSFSTSADPLPPPSFSSCSILLQFLIFSPSSQLSLSLFLSPLASR